MNKTTEKILRAVSGFTGKFEGAFNIREDGQCAGRQSSKNIKIESKEDGPGLIIKINPNTKGERVYIPACVTHGNVDDLVYNDFYVGQNADVTIVAGCGVHTDDGHDARHNGIHRFFLEENAHVIYEEKHIATGKGMGKKSIDPVTDVYLKKNSVLEMDTIQLEGVDTSVRKTSGVLEDGAKLLVRERIMTDEDERAQTDFDVVLKGENAAVDLISRSVAKGNSYQEFNSVIDGKTKCVGHSECDAILVDNGSVVASPSLKASNIDAELIHEAAIGKIAGEQILKLQSLGLTKEEAEEKIISGFLK